MHCTPSGCGSNNVWIGTLNAKRIKFRKWTAECKDRGCASTLKVGGGPQPKLHQFLGLGYLS